MDAAAEAGLLVEPQADDGRGQTLTSGGVELNFASLAIDAGVKGPKSKKKLKKHKKQA